MSYYTHVHDSGDGITCTECPSIRDNSDEEFRRVPWMQRWRRANETA
jgi:hypothetical protein